MCPSWLKRFIDNSFSNKGYSKQAYWQYQIVLLLRIFQAVYRDLISGLPAMRAMSLVYTTLLSLVPMLAVSFTVLKTIGAHNQIKPLLLKVLEPLGDGGMQITEHLFVFVDNMKVGLLGILGVALLTYTIIALVHKIERAFNHTWHITTYKNIWQRLGSYASVITIGPIFVFVAIIITAAISSTTLLEPLLTIEPFGSIIQLFGKIAPYLLIITAFTFIFWVIPNTRVQLTSALTGAIVAGTLWESTGYLFAFFVAKSTNYTIVYSGLAALMIFMIWLYLSWLIVLIGASISYYHQFPERISNRQQTTQLSSRLQEKIALLIMNNIAEQQYFNRPVKWTSHLLSKTLDVSLDAIEAILLTLEQSRLISRTRKDRYAYSLAKPIGDIAIREIWDSIRQANESVYLKPENLNSTDSIDDILTKINNATVGALQNITLLDIIKK